MSSDAIVPSEELTAEDRGALGWAVSTDHPLGTAIVERVRSGGSGVTGAELLAVREAWEQAGRSRPKAHVHRTPVTLEDGSRVTGVTFVTDDPYAREEIPSFGLYLDERWSPPWEHAQLAWPDFGLP